MPGPHRTAPDGEDINIIAATDGDLAAASAFAATADTSHALALIAGLPGKAPPPLGVEAPAPFSGALALDAPPKLLKAQLTALIRAALAQEERTRRFATAALLEVAPPKPLDPRKLKALYIGAPSPIFLALEAALSAHGGLVAAAFSSFTGFDHLHDEPFDAVVLNGAQDPLTAVSLCAALRRNASLYHLPTMVVTAQGDQATAASAIERGASAVAAVNQPCGNSLAWLFEAMRRERGRRSAEHEIRALRDLMGDARTGLFQRSAFDAHVARMAADHHLSGRPMSLVALHVMPAPGAREPSEQVWKRGFNEIASLAGRLMRETDSGCAIGGSLIALALPATPLSGAKRTAERVASVSECTAFASGEGSSGPLVFEQSAVELQPGESGSGLLARALRAIDAESIPA